MLFTSTMLPGCSSDDEQERPDAPEQVEILPEVIFSISDNQPLHFHLDTRGTVEPVREIPIITRVNGFLRKHSIRNGHTVARGDTLFAFSDEEWKVNYDEAENNYLTALQEFQLESRQRGTRRPVADTTAADQFDERLLRNHTGYMQAKTALERARLELSYTFLTAPFDGEIFTEDIHTDGAYISNGQKLGRLIDYSRIQIHFDVLESELVGLRRGMNVEITAADGSTLRGSITGISPVVDRERKTGRIIVEADNPGKRLKPGMTVDGRVFMDSVEGRVRAPRAAMLERDGRPLVFKLKGNQVEWVYIEPKAVTSEWVVFDDEAVSPGDTLAVDRHFAISHLQRVRPSIR